MTKEIKFNVEARDGLKRGVDALANAVKVTLGAKGRNVIIENEYDIPHVTKDGVTVAKSISLEDPIENMGAMMMRDVASKAADDAGDGTTTATVLAQAIVTEGLKNVAAGANPMELKKGIDQAVNDIVSELNMHTVIVSHDDKMIKHIAKISANGDEEMGDLIADIIARVSAEGTVNVEESRTSETYTEIVEGYKFVNGLLSPLFVTNEDKLNTEFEKPLIFIYDGKIDTFKKFMNVYKMAIDSGRPLLIIANDFDGHALETIIANKMKAGFKVAAVKSPSVGEKRKMMLEDIALVTGGEVFSDEKYKPEDFTMEMFGSSDKVIIDREDTAIIQGNGDEAKVKERIEQLNRLAEEAKQEFDADIFKDRVARMLGAVAVLYVGANTPTELKERMDRIDDALSATRAAVKEGIVAGGGVALLNVQRVLKNTYITATNSDVHTGKMIVLKALEAPIRQIVANAGLEGSVIIKELNYDEVPNGRGFDVVSEDYVDMIDSGIIDPKKVTRVALESAASVASLILTTECSINNKRK